MDFFFRHWAACTRQFPSPFRLNGVGELKEKDHRIRQRFENCNFSFVLRGRGDLHHNGRTYKIEAPCVISQSPGDDLDYGPNAPETWDEIFLMYQADSLEAFQKRGFLDTSRLFWPMRNFAAVMAHIEELRKIYMNPSVESADRIDQICEGMIFESLVPSPGDNPHADANDELIQPIVSQLQERPVSLLDLDQIAKRQGMSASTLRRRWSEKVKSTPGRYQLNLRLQTAQRLLAETTLPISEVATKAGFQDMFYFSRRFKMETGVTATAYRRIYQTSSTASKPQAAPRAKTKRTAPAVPDAAA